MPLRPGTALLLLALGASACAPRTESGASTLDGALEAAAPWEELDVVVRLAPSPGRPAPSPGPVGRRAFVQALRASGAEASAPVIQWLAGRGVHPRASLWAIDALALRAEGDVIRDLRRLPGVLEVTLDAPFAAPVVATGGAAPAEWNLSSVRAQELWGKGLTGAGAVVAILDTGVSLEHPDLGPGWRGGPADWFDPFRATSTPYDPLGHGTQALGVAVGGSASGTAIGLAPGARWIAAKIYDDLGRSSASQIHLALQWALDPDGDPETDDAPDVVNASWGSLAAGTCDLTFLPDLDVLRAAGIAVVVAAGNLGPAEDSSASPANNPGAISAGAHDASGAIADFSSRGPSACTGGIFPDVVAPGVDVMTADRPAGGVSQWIPVSGTSVAAPHVAGAVALLLGAFPETPLARLEEALRSGARDLSPDGPDTAAGYGGLDVLRAWAQLARRSALSIATASLPAADEGRPWATQLEARGGAGPRSWSILAGAPPPGTALDPSGGALAGVPGVPGIFHFTVGVRDGSGQAASAALAVRVDPSAPLALGGAPLPAPVLGAPYLGAIAASGGARPWSFSIASGSPPPGLALNPGTGELTGIPSAAGRFGFIVTVSDALGAAASRELLVDVATAPLSVATLSLRACVAGYACARPVAAAGGIAPYSWAMSEGAPPPGLAFDAVTGTLSGTPTAAGSYAFVLQVSDSAGATATRALAIAVL